MASPLTDLLLGARERQRVAVMEVLRRGVVWFIMVLMLTCSGCVSGEMLRVGGSQGWKTDVNYTEWSSQQHFYVGLWLYFLYDRKMYDVLEVNQTDYENCISTHPITNVTRGAGRDVFYLAEPKEYYFLSAGGYCYHGMKLAVLVHDIPPSPAPSPTKTNTGSPSGSRGGRILLPTLLAIAVFWMNSIITFR